MTVQKRRGLESTLVNPTHVECQRNIHRCVITSYSNENHLRNVFDEPTLTEDFYITIEGMNPEFNVEHDPPPSYEQCTC